MSWQSLPANELGEYIDITFNPMRLHALSLTQTVLANPFSQTLLEASTQPAGMGHSGLASELLPVESSADYTPSTPSTQTIVANPASQTPLEAPTQPARMGDLASELPPVESSADYTLPAPSPNLSLNHQNTTDAYPPISLSHSTHSIPPLPVIGLHSPSNPIESNAFFSQWSINPPTPAVSRLFPPQRPATMTLDDNDPLCYLTNIKEFDALSLMTRFQPELQLFVCD
ncbi:hypothetical protein BDR03DRAFT_1017626 [Suillus americanus]|nr:hypothetical protein BDR03DRAFT_1017626 [Suillus americanus]